jgi:PAS domain S-box-containing protein
LFRMVKGYYEKCLDLVSDIRNYKKTKDALKCAQEQLSTTIREQQGMTFKFTKVNGRFIHTLCDGELLYRLGLTPEQVVGKSLEMFVPKDEAKCKSEFYARAWQGEEHVNYEGIHNGITYLASLRPVKREGRVVEVIASCVDITQLKETEELLRESETLSLIGELAASVAHEVRNPLTTLKGFLQMSQENKQGQIQPEHLTLMLEELDRVNFIVSEFLSLAKKEADTQYKETKIIDILRSTITLMEPQGNMNNIQIKLEAFEENSLVRCEPNQIKQVFINVMKNAIESMTEGGMITVQLKTTDQHTSIRISDEGCGIPNDRLPKLGQPLYTTKEKGTGLGLLVCKNIIKNHNGSLNIFSEVDRGTVVEIVLPID